jgi:hypothetical protein
MLVVPLIGDETVFSELLKAGIIQRLMDMESKVTQQQEFEVLDCVSRYLEYVPPSLRLSGDLMPFLMSPSNSILSF